MCIRDRDIPPHIPLGGVFVKPPANEGEMFMGSSTVLAEGEPFTFMSCQVLTCHDIGMIPPPRPKKKGGTKTMVLPTSIVLPIPCLLYTSPSPRDRTRYRMPSSA